MSKIKQHLTRHIFCMAMFITQHCFEFSSGKVGNYDITNVLDYMLAEERYDRRLRPYFHGPPVNITIGFWLLSLDNIDVLNMDYVVDIYFRQEWTDPRLDIGKDEYITLASSIKNQIWMPDTYFVNSKEGRFHMVTVDNSFFKLGPGGRVKSNSRLTIKAACIMNLRMFPMDRQKCPLTLESYGYSSNDIIFEWEPNGEKIFVPDSLRHLSQFDLLGITLKKTKTTYIAGNWSGLSATFNLERNPSYFFLNLYAPCALIVIMSWMSFYLPYEQYPARIALGVTALLTIVTLLSMFNTSMPKVSYVKYIDIYLIGSFGFVFSTLLEYYTVLSIARLKRKRESFNNLSIQEKIQENSRREESRISTETSMDMDGTYHSETSCSYFDCIRDKVYTDEFISRIDDISKIMFFVFFGLFNAVYWSLMMNEKSVDRG